MRHSIPLYGEVKVACLPRWWEVPSHKEVGANQPTSAKEMWRVDEGDEERWSAEGRDAKGA